ncbi:hypothetical protein [Rhizobium sp. BK176]|uniref:hypothetical protein n=1 Tax=Rhizobium sp. BK176 TaxID=2587071 RepID=UPI002166EA0F|nr:hypothetical protein [Rhizobium sp. BK176]MCS4089676.1 hypothetical protein [Rhizobium sp. BK176]
MKITARLPVYVRGQPVRNNGPRDILVSTDLEWDIPEISMSEADVAFESFNAFVAVLDESDPLQRRSTLDAVDSHVVALKHNGDLYRRVSKPGEAIRFDMAYPAGHDHSWEDGVGTDISLPTFSFGGDEERRHRPFSLPVFKQHLWQLKCNSVLDTTFLNHETWPQSFPAVRDAADLGQYGRRNSVSFEDVLAKLVSYDDKQLEDCRRTNVGHMEKFLLVDGQLWMKTRPPVFKVGRRYGSAHKPAACVSVDFAPDWQDTRLANAYFGLSAADEAFDYARRMCDALADRKSGAEAGEVVDATCNDHIVHDPEIHAYSHEPEELRRVASGLAVEARRYLVRNESWQERFGEDAVNGVFRAYEQVRATNYVLGEYGDPSDWIESNATIWRKTRRGNSTYGFGSVALGDLLIERAIGYDENKPISVNAVQLSGSAPGRN